MQNVYHNILVSCHVFALRFHLGFGTDMDRQLVCQDSAYPALSTNVMHQNEIKTKGRNSNFIQETPHYLLAMKFIWIGPSQNGVYSVFSSRKSIMILGIITLAGMVFNAIISLYPGPGLLKQIHVKNQWFPGMDPDSLTASCS